MYNFTVKKHNRYDAKNIQQQPPSDLTVSLGGLFFAFPEQIFFVAVHLVLFFFGQALALFAGFV